MPRRTRMNVAECSVPSQQQQKSRTTEQYEEDFFARHRHWYRSKKSVQNTNSRQQMRNARDKLRTKERENRNARRMWAKNEYQTYRMFHCILSSLVRTEPYERNRTNDWMQKKVFLPSMDWMCIWKRVNERSREVDGVLVRVVSWYFGFVHIYSTWWMGINRVITEDVHTTHNRMTQTNKMEAL